MHQETTMMWHGVQGESSYVRVGPIAPSPRGRALGSSDTTPMAMRAGWPTAGVTPGTELGGLRESNFISCFISNFIPMCPASDDSSIREGIMYAMAKPSQGLEGHGDLRRGQALQCSFYSSLAIGAIMLGYPSDQVSRYMESAQLCREQCRYLVDRLAVSALVLYSVASAFLGQAAAYRQGMEEARALSRRSPDVDPAVSSYLRLQRFTESLRSLTADMLDGDNPIDAVRGPGGEGLVIEVETLRGRHVCDLIEDGRSNNCSFSSTMSAYPSLVVSDGLFLTLRYYTTVLEDGTPALTHVHGYLASELDHLVLAGAGAVVLVLLSGLLMAVKARLSRADGLLPLAELALSQFHTLPGLARFDTRLCIYPALAVFRLYGKPEEYCSLRQIAGAASQDCVPTFDECHPGNPLCPHDVVAAHAEKILTLGV
ncbi:unnamed protein product [Ectocarpus sp. 12 AP-2014]